MAPQIKPTFGGLLDLIQEFPILTLGAIVLIVISLIQFFSVRRKKLNLPIVGRTEDADHKTNILEGIAKYPNRPFVIPSVPELVILPPSIINEVRNLPENRVSFQQDVERMFFTRQTGIASDAQPITRVVKQDLTRHIASTLDALQDEIRYGFDKELGKCEDWTEVQLYPKMARVVALLSGRVFVGRPLSREEEWIQATVNYALYAMRVVNACQKYSNWPIWLQDWIVPTLEEVKELMKFQKRGAELMRPLLEAQLSKRGNEKLWSDAGEEGFSDEQCTFISWLLSHTDESQRKDPQALANNQMTLSFAAIHTTTMAATAAVYDLCVHPEALGPLREEIDAVMAEDGYDTNENGFLKLKKSSIPKLWKLDSFLKESQRFTPPGLVSNGRVTTNPLTLSTGDTLPTGTRFAFPSWAVHHTECESTSLPNCPSKPLSEFDPLRHYNLRLQPGESNKHQFVTTSTTSLNFGHGIHACPGRFFAGNEIKVVLIELLREWDFRLAGGKTERPANVWREYQCAVDMAAGVEFRRRKR